MGKKIQEEIKQLLKEGNQIAREKLYGDAAIGEWSASLPKKSGPEGDRKFFQSKMKKLSGIGLNPDRANKLEHRVTTGA